MKSIKRNITKDKPNVSNELLTSSSNMKEIKKTNANKKQNKSDLNVSTSSNTSANSTNTNKEEHRRSNINKTTILKADSKKGRSIKKTIKKAKKEKNLTEFNIACFKEVFRIAKGKNTATGYLKQCKVDTTLLEILKSDEEYLTLSNVVFKEMLLKTLAKNASNDVTYEEFVLSLQGKVYKGRNFNQQSNPDKIVELIKKAMGPDSISSFSSQIKVTRHIISLLLQKKIDVITPKIIDKIGSRLSEYDKDELYDAFGYPTERNSFMSKEDKTIISMFAKDITREQKKTTTKLLTTENSKIGLSKEFSRISDVRWDIFKKEVFNKFFRYYNYQQINEIVPMPQEDYWDLKEDDKTQIKMSYKKYKKYVIKLASLPLCKQTPMELLTYLRLDDEAATPQWKYNNYLDIIFIDEPKLDIAEKTGLSINTVHAFKKQISDRSIKRLSVVYNHISEQELLKYATEAGALLVYTNKGHSIGRSIRKNKTSSK